MATFLILSLGLLAQGQGSKENLLGPTFPECCSKLRPCWVIGWAMWGSVEVSGMTNSTPIENLSVGVHFGGGTWGAMSDQCWAVLGLCWARVGLFGFHGGLCKGGGNDRIIRNLMMRSFLWVSVGPMLGNLGSKLGPCWVIWWAMLGWASRRFQKLCRTNVVPFWVFVGSMLGHLGQACAMLGLHWAMPGLFCFVLTKMVSRMVPNDLHGSESWVAPSMSKKKGYRWLNSL